MSKVRFAFFLLFPYIVILSSDRIHKIIDYLGTPSEDILCRLESVQAQDYIRSLPIKPRVPFFTLFPQANPLAIDLLSQLLCFDPEKRISCDEALHHPYLHVWHDPVDEPVCNSVLAFMKNTKLFPTFDIITSDI